MVKKYLFICLANIDRSKTGEIVFKDMLKERGYSVGSLEEILQADFYVGSAGVRANEFGCKGYSVQYSSEIGDGADVIFVADELVFSLLKEMDSKNLAKVVQLDIPDTYKASDEVDYRKMVDLFKDKLLPYMPKKKQ